MFLGLIQTSPRLRSVAAVPPELRTYHLSEMCMIHVHLRSTGYHVSTDRYSVLGYLVLIITNFSTFRYLVSEIYFIGKIDIRLAILQP